jgi:uncharacterized membrane protein YphA (DoxX/SURF4 family)
MTLSWWVGVLELILGTFITLGLFTRVAAFIASGEMAFAYWIAHAPRDFSRSTMDWMPPFFTALFSCSSSLQGPASGASMPCGHDRKM